MPKPQTIELLVTDRKPDHIKRILNITATDLYQVPKRSRVLIPGSGMFPGDLIKNIRAYRNDLTFTSIDPSLAIQSRDVLEGKCGIFYRAVDDYNVALYHAPMRTEKFTYLPAEQAARFHNERLNDAKSSGAYIPDYVQNIRLAERSLGLVIDCLGPTYYLRVLQEKIEYIQSLVRALVPNGIAFLYSVSFVEGVEHIPMWQESDAVMHTTSIIENMGNVTVKAELICEDQSQQDYGSLRVRIQKKPRKYS